jgi:ABC-type branched-subunit amino acid transport system ATPase component
VTTTLRCEDLHFSYGSTQVLFGVDLHVEPGERLALVGTNGAGKSTVLRCVSGLERPQQGRVLLGGRDVTGWPAERLVAEGLVLVQGGRGVFPDLTVKENVEIAGMLAPRDRAARVDALLAAFPSLGERWGQQARTLSGGQQQQLALAKAVLHDPALLCIDELSLGLAPITVEALLAVVRSLADRGVTLVLVEQSLNIAASLCERAVFLEKGEVRFEGRTADLLAREDIARAVFFGGQPAAAAPEKKSRSRRTPAAV